ncbi:MAG: right-handed parallel beta-helix repeat-containing protein, partial [Chitinophagaceae bacterium]|nr:right-handed parallel beta-helix repeat-containing protein [Chitinophagaceae bacterium]
SGYLIYEKAAGNTSITDDDLKSSVNWSGAEVVIRKNRWVIDRNKVTTQQGSTIVYQSETTYPATKNYGYFFQNHPGALDVDGEWYYDERTHKIGLHYERQHLSTPLIEVSQQEILIDLRFQSDLSFNNLCIKGANSSAFELGGTSRITINNCEILHSGTNAINANGNSGLLISDVLINHTNNIAFNGNNCTNTLIRNSRILNTGLLPGMGRGGSGSYTALSVSGRGNVIEYNQIDSTGYVPITFSGDQVVVKNNVINHFGFVKDDGGGIYTWNNAAGAERKTARKITGNIILNGKGAGAGTDHPEDAAVFGIYLDDNSNDVVVADNTIAWCRESGIYVHNANDIKLDRNTVYDNNCQLKISHDNVAPNRLIRNISSSGNIFFAKHLTQAVAQFKTVKNDLADFGNFDNNYYCRPFDDLLTIFSSYRLNGTAWNKWHDVEGWKLFSSKDRSSKRSPKSINPFDITGVIGNNKLVNGNFNTDIKSVSSYFPERNGSISWNNQGKIQGGSLQILYNKITGYNKKASVIISIGEVSAGKKYLLKLSVMGSEDLKNLEAFIRKSRSPYNDLSARRNVSIKSSITSHEIVIAPSVSEAEASLVFDIEEQNGPIFIDNIQLTEVSAQPVDPKDSIRFDYNPTTITKTVPLDGRYIDVKGKEYKGSVQIPPFSSVILIAAKGVANDQPPLPIDSVPEVSKPADTLVDNPPAGFLYLAGVQIDTRIDVSWSKLNPGTDATYELERSENGIAFKKIGKVKAGKGAVRADYTIPHYNPKPGSNYYRIKVRPGSLGNYYSNTIQVQYLNPTVNTARLSTQGADSILIFPLPTPKPDDGKGFTDGDIKITPNPASEKIQIKIANLESQKKLTILITDEAGIIMKTVDMKPGINSVEMDVSAWGKGLYIASFIQGSRRISKKFITQ